MGGRAVARLWVRGRGGRGSGLSGVGGREGERFQLRLVPPTGCSGQRCAMRAGHGPEACAGDLCRTFSLDKTYVHPGEFCFWHAVPSRTYVLGLAHCVKSDTSGSCILWLRHSRGPREPKRARWQVGQHGGRRETPDSDLRHASETSGVFGGRSSRRGLPGSSRAGRVQVGRGGGNCGKRSVGPPGTPLPHSARSA